MFAQQINSSQSNQFCLVTYFVLLSFFLLLLSGCAEEGGSCVTVTNDGNYYCFNIGEESNLDNGLMSHCSEDSENTFHINLSCEDVGYRYFCSGAQMRQSGQNGGSAGYAVSRWLTNSMCDAGKPPGGSSGGSGANCYEECPSEFSDVQKDSFCRAACCYAVTGNPDAAESTCASGESLGSRDCRYCR